MYFPARVLAGTMYTTNSTQRKPHQRRKVPPPNGGTTRDSNCCRRRLRNLPYKLTSKGCVQHQQACVWGMCMDGHAVLPLLLALLMAAATVHDSDEDVIPHLICKMQYVCYFHEAAGALALWMC